MLEKTAVKRDTNALAEAVGDRFHDVAVHVQGVAANLQKDWSERQATIIGALKRERYEETVKLREEIAERPRLSLPRA